MKEWFKANGKKILYVTTAVFAVLGVGMVAYCKGRVDEAEHIIDISESDSKQHYVVASRKRERGDLMYEIKAECIGD